MDAGKSNPDSEVSAAGDLGDRSAPESAPTKFDCRLIDLALRERWDIPPAARLAMVEALADVVQDAALIRSKPRLYLACARTLIGLSRANLEMVGTALKAKSQEELEERLAALETAAGKHKGERFS